MARRIFAIFVRETVVRFFTILVGVKRRGVSSQYLDEKCSPYFYLQTNFRGGFWFMACAAYCEITSAIFRSHCKTKGVGPPLFVWRNKQNRRAFFHFCEFGVSGFWLSDFCRLFWLFWLLPTSRKSRQSQIPPTFPDFPRLLPTFLIFLKSRKSRKSRQKSESQKPETPNSQKGKKTRMFCLFLQIKRGGPMLSVLQWFLKIADFISQYAALAINQKSPRKFASATI